MKNYDKDVVTRRFRQRRMARKSATNKGADKLINLFFLLFAVGAVVLLAFLAISFLG